MCLGIFGGSATKGERFTSSSRSWLAHWRGTGGRDGAGLSSSESMQSSDAECSGSSELSESSESARESAFSSSESTHSDSSRLGSSRSESRSSSSMSGVALFAGRSSLALRVRWGRGSTEAAYLKTMEAARRFSRKSVSLAAKISARAAAAADLRERREGSGQGLGGGQKNDGADGAGAEMSCAARSVAVGAGGLVVSMTDPLWLKRKRTPWASRLGLARRWGQNTAGGKFVKWMYG